MTKKELKHVNSLKEENDRVKNLLMRFVDALGKLTNIDDVVNMALIPIMTEENQKFRAEIKAEAYKEFVNKIKVHAYYIDFPKEHRVVDEDDIDNLLKELVGDK